MQPPTHERSAAAVVTVNEPPQNRVSWGAIFAGVVVALALYILLSLLGLGIGLSTINPTTDENPVSTSLGIGVGIWSVISLVVALFAGGWVAGRLSGVARHTAGLLHGLVVWSLSTVFLMYLLTTAVGSVLGGAMSILKSAASLAGQGVAAVAQPVGEEIRQRVQDDGVDWTSIRQEAMQILRQTGEPELQPENLRQEAREATDQARTGVREADQQQAEQELGAALDRLFSRAERIASEADKEAVANVLAARTEMTPQEARQRVDEWDSTYQGLREAAGEQMSDLRQGAERTAESVAGGVASAAIWTFIALLLAAIAAAWGGRAGAPEMIEVVNT